MARVVSEAYHNPESPGPWRSLVTAGLFQLPASAPHCGTNTYALLRSMMKLVTAPDRHPATSRRAVDKPMAARSSAADTAGLTLTYTTVVAITETLSPESDLQWAELDQSQPVN